MILYHTTLYNRIILLAGGIYVRALHTHVATHAHTHQSMSAAFELISSCPLIRRMSGPKSIDGVKCLGKNQCRECVSVSMCVDVVLDGVSKAEV